MSFFRKILPKKEKQPLPKEIEALLFTSSKEQLLDIQDKYILDAFQINTVGGTFKSLKEYELSEKAFLQSIKLLPKYEDPYGNLISLYSSLKQYEKGESIYRKGMDNSSSKSFIIFHYGRLQFIKGNYPLTLATMKSILNVKDLQHDGVYLLAIRAAFEMIKTGKDTHNLATDAMSLWQEGIAKFPESKELKELAPYFVEDEDLHLFR